MSERAEFALSGRKGKRKIGKFSNFWYFFEPGGALLVGFMGVAHLYFIAFPSFI